MAAEDAEQLAKILTMFQLEPCEFLSWLLWDQLQILNRPQHVAEKVDMAGSKPRLPTSIR